MREISKEILKEGEHIVIDGVVYVAEARHGKVCEGCDMYNRGYCHIIPCTIWLILKRVEKQHTKEQEKAK